MAVLHFADMIRLFDLRDLPLVHRLREHCISLHAESAFVSGSHFLRNALAGMVIGRGASTYVWKAEESSMNRHIVHSNTLNSC